MPQSTSFPYATSMRLSPWPVSSSCSPNMLLQTRPLERYTSTTLKIERSEVASSQDPKNTMSFPEAACCGSRSVKAGLLFESIADQAIDTLGCRLLILYCDGHHNGRRGDNTSCGRLLRNVLQSWIRANMGMCFISWASPRTNTDPRTDHRHPKRRGNSRHYKRTSVLRSPLP